MVIDKLIIDENQPHLILGPRLAVDICRRVRELECRYRNALSSAERRELSRLKALLRLRPEDEQ